MSAEPTKVFKNRVPIPANIKLLELPPNRLDLLRPVTALDIFDGMTDEFHVDGLFSIQTFGRTGSKERDFRFSYVDIKVEIFHPFIYKNLISLKGLYGGIMSGKAYATCNKEERDFESSDMVNGSTGFHFFMRYWKDLKFKHTNSYQRKSKIEMIEKYRANGTATYTKIMVLPAGLRDIQMQEDGRYKQSEINDLYRKVINAANAISASSDLNTPIIDVSRYNLQLGFNDIFLYLESLIEGKGGFLQGKFGSRGIVNGMRNVITAMDTTVANLDDPNTFGIDSTGVGLYQVSKGLLPVTIHKLLTTFSNKLFNSQDGSAYLINPSSLRSELVSVSPKVFDLWNTTNGLEKIISSLEDENIRDQPVMVEDRYLALIYRGPNGTFRIFGDINDLPIELSADDVFPITYIEMVYLCNYNGWNKYPALITRYPITGAGSIYNSYIYCKTTVNSEMRRELDGAWQPMEGDEYLALEYPVLTDPVYINSLVPHTTRLAGMGGDFDGDTCSCNILYSDEALLEAFVNTNSLKSYVTPSGGLINSANTDTVARILFNMTGHKLA